MGTRVYLSCTLTDELVDGHCLIVPIQHHLNMLEGDDDVWDETRVGDHLTICGERCSFCSQNFMKCLMRMCAEEDKGVIFFETVLSMKKQRHTFIECIPVPWELFDLLPGYFKVRQSDLLCQSQDAAYQTVGVNTFLRGRVVTAQKTY